MSMPWYRGGRGKSSTDNPIVIEAPEPGPDADGAEAAEVARQVQRDRVLDAFTAWRRAERAPRRHP